MKRIVFDYKFLDLIIKNIKLFLFFTIIMPLLLTVLINKYNSNISVEITYRFNSIFEWHDVINSKDFKFLYYPNNNFYNYNFFLSNTEELFNRNIIKYNEKVYSEDKMEKLPDININQISNKKYKLSLKINRKNDLNESEALNHLTKIISLADINTKKNIIDFLEEYVEESQNKKNNSNNFNLITYENKRINNDNINLSINFFILSLLGYLSAFFILYLKQYIKNKLYK
jgi:hypothetical protein